ncbi:MAG: protein translocase subunit SecF [Deltaproteobacteria bacterium]|jgi:preprotein translocase subunit SecF|nr:protein translocase subunit SecF [Deltaproteobacteria bacterium]
MGFTLIKETHIDFVGQRYIAYVLSVIFLVGALISMWYSGGLRMGIDFAGGVIVQVQFQRPVDDEALKHSLDTEHLPGLSTQRFGEGGRDYLLRFSTLDTSAQELRDNVLRALKAAFPDNGSDIARLEMVGPKVGADLAHKAMEALYYSVLLIAVYISGRFEYRWLAAAAMAAALWGGVYAVSLFGVGTGGLVVVALVITIVVSWRLKLNFALGAVVGLLHDVFITLGILTVLGKEIDLNVVAALLTLAGWSLNDTIIVYDRIRENLRKAPTHELSVIINDSINQTLSRTLLTSGTTFVAVLSLFLVGGGVIHDFAFTMLVGVIIGTLSSIYVSAPILLVLGTTEQYVHIQRQQSYEKPGEHGIV